MILVTGATGTVGSELLRQLSARGQKVRAFVRSPEKLPRLAGVEPFAGDLMDRRSVEAALKGAEKVFLLCDAGPHQVEAQGNLIQASRRSGVRLLVKISALGADAQSPINLARWHSKTEDELRRADVPHAVLQPHFFMQNTLAFAPTVKEQGAFYGAVREGKAALVDARDVAAVAAVVLTGRGHEGRTYVVTGGEALSFDDVAEKLSAALDKRVRYVDLTAAELKKGMLQAGMPPWLADDKAALQVFLSTNGGAVATRVVRDLTGSPPRTFDAFAREFAASFR
jgi:uncharacterized protein YbjT (DUF2867 family)